MFAVEVKTGSPSNSREAEDAYQQLLLELQMFAPDAIIEPSPKAAIAEQRFIAELTAFAVTGLKLGLFSGIVDICKTWLQQRPKAEIILRAKDGSELKITNATPKQAIELFAKQNNIL